MFAVSVRLSTTLMALSASGVRAGEVSTFRAYVDSDICARLMLGPLTNTRVECSKSTFKEGSLPVLVRLPNQMVFTANKQKMLEPLVGQLAEVSGEAKPKNGTIKLQAANAITPGSISQDDPARSEKLLSRIPAGRWGEPSDMGGAAVFLASRASDYCHGTILVVDGGWLAG